MPESNADDTTSPRRRKLFRLTRRPAASWSERASNEASPALAPAPGVAEDKAERQGAPEPEEGVAEDSGQPAADSVPPSTSATAPPPVEQPSWRDLDAPALP